jgi:hypothetical protein
MPDGIAASDCPLARSKKRRATPNAATAIPEASKIVVTRGLSCLRR